MIIVADKRACRGRIACVLAGDVNDCTQSSGFVLAPDRAEEVLIKRYQGPSTKAETAEILRFHAVGS